MTSNPPTVAPVAPGDLLAGKYEVKRVLGVGGKLTTSPLQCREVAGATGLPVFDRVDLAEPVTACKLVAAAREGWERE